MNQIMSAPELRFPLAVRLALKTLAVAWALLALGSVPALVFGVRAVMEGQAESLIRSALVLNRVYGKLVVGPLVQIAILCALAWCFWKFSSRTRAMSPLASGIASAQNGRTHARKAVRIPLFMFLAGAMMFAVEAALGAFTILIVQTDGFDRTLFRFDHVRKLYWWLPIGLALTFTICARLCQRIAATQTPPAP